MRFGRFTAIESAEAEAVLPDLRLARRLAHRPFGQRTIRPVSSASGMKSPGGTSDAALPAHQRLGADHAAPRTSTFGW
jgi:hypothetical protein